MEVFLIKALQLILSISILVILHEGGHFFFAKLFGIRVHRFSLFFDFWKGGKKKALKLGRWGNTDFVIGWLPFGGYVEIAGMVDESSDAEAVAKEEASLPANELFKNKPAWQRLFVMVGGVLVNFLLALFIYAMLLWSNGEQRVPLKGISHGMSFNTEAKKLGFQDGDLITGVDSKTYTYLDHVALLRDLGDAHTVHVLRNGKQLDINIEGGFDLLKALKQQPPFVALTLPSVVDSVLAESPAKRAGLHKGDTIVALNGHEVSTWNEIDNLLYPIQDKIAAAEGKGVDAKLLQTTLVVKHAAQDKKQMLNGAADTLRFSLNAEGKLGVTKHNVLLDYPTETIYYSFLEAIPAGISHGLTVLKGYVSDLRYLFSADGVKSVGSFGAIGSMFPSVWNWTAFWSLTAFISLMLAFMNFLPIPMLDGGYIFITLIEIITRRRLSDKWIGYVNTVGFYFVLGLMALGIFNDVVRFIF